MSDVGEVRARYARRADKFTATVDSVPADRWDDQSPCEQWTARQVVEHVAANTGVFLASAGEPPPPLPPVAVDPAATWRASDRAARAALADPGLANREFDGYFGRTTLANAIDAFLSFDLVVHRWDLARATGQDGRLDPEEIDQIRAAAAAFGPALRSASVCGPALEVPADADAQTALLAFLGRRG